MPILLDQPHEEPATEAKSFPALFVTSLNVRATPTAGIAQIEARPMNPDTGELSQSGAITIDCQTLWEAVDAVPEVAAALEAVLAAVLPIKAWVEAQAAEPQEPANPPV